MCPALRMRQSCLLRILRIDAVAVGVQNAIGRQTQAQRLLRMPGMAAGVVQETDFVAFAIHGLEVRLLHFARTSPSGLDRRFIHGFDARGANRRQLGPEDGFEQGYRLLCQLRQPAACNRNAGIAQAQVL